jgi:hypothetical protein
VSQRHPAFGVIAHEYVPALGCNHEVCELAEFLLDLVAIGGPGAPGSRQGGLGGVVQGAGIPIRADQRAASAVALGGTIGLLAMAAGGCLATNRGSSTSETGPRRPARVVSALGHERPPVMHNEPITLKGVVVAKETS